MSIDSEESMDAMPVPYPPQLAVGVTRDRIRNVSAEARAVHRSILLGFATAGRAPDQATLADVVPAGRDMTMVMAQLHDRDVVRLDDDGAVRAAYPFSAVPTPHVVEIDDGPTVYAMCAIDALGISEMVGRSTVIRSSDPATDESVRVAVRQGQAVWQPDTAVVYVGSTASATAPGECCPPSDAGDQCVTAAADRCCTVMNFFASPDTVAAWQAGHPDVSGVVLSQEQALRLGVDIFGALLSTSQDEP